MIGQSVRVRDCKHDLGRWPDNPPHSRRSGTVGARDYGTRRVGRYSGALDAVSGNLSRRLGVSWARASGWVCRAECARVARDDGDFGL